VTQRVSPALVELTALALWLGAAGFFSCAVAPALFAALPTRSLAGAVVGRLLPSVFYSGIVIGILVVAVEVAVQRAWTWNGRSVAGAVMIGACAISQLFVAPRIDRIRSEIPGPVEDLAIDDARRIAFGRLHGVSVGWLGLAMLAAVIAMVLAARTLQSRSTS
jgi:hypothetical protein